MLDYTRDVHDGKGDKLETNAISKHFPILGNKILWEQYMTLEKTSSIE